MVEKSEANDIWPQYALHGRFSTVAFDLIRVTPSLLIVTVGFREVIICVNLLPGVFCVFGQLEISVNVVNCLPEFHKQIPFGDNFHHPFMGRHGEWPSIPVFVGQIPLKHHVCWLNPIKI